MIKYKFQKLVVTPLIAAGLMVSSVSPAMSMTTPIFTETQKSEVVIVYKNEAGKQKVLDHAIEVKDEFATLKAINVVVTESAILLLKNDPDISYIEREVAQEVELLGTPGQWNVEAVNAPKAWEQGITGQGIKVAIVDTGVANHNELPNVVKRVSFVEDNPATLTDESSPFDHNGHGTHVAGIVGAKIGGPTSGGREFVGVAPNASLYSLKVMDGEQGSILNVIEAIDWAIANDMDIINLSLGLTDHVQLLQDAVDRAYRAGILLVGAAGNDNVGSPVNYPAKYASVIAVSSVDSGKTISSFSSTGAEVEFAAPGGNVPSTYVDNTYAIMGGTSQAAPHVAGFLTLLMQKNPSKTASELRSELQRYAEDLGVKGRDTLYGYGFINYTALDETAPGNVADLKAIAAEADSITVSFTKPADPDFAKTSLYLNGVLSGETNADTYTFTNLSAGTEYTITAKTADIKGNLSNGVSILAKTNALADTAAPAPTSPDGRAPAPENNGEIAVTKETWIESDNKIRLAVPANQATFTFSPDVWNELKVKKKDLFLSLDGLSFLMPKENIADLTLENKTAIAFGSDTSSAPIGAKLITNLVKIEMVDQVTQKQIKTFKKPISIAIDMPAAASAAAEKAVFGVRLIGDLKQWQYAGGKLVDSNYVIQTKQLASFAVMENGKTFVDIRNHWAQPEIEHLASRLIIQGKTADLFSPNEEITRSQFVVLLARMLSIPTKGYTGTFKDVTASQSWSAGYIEAAYRYGITTGFADGTFKPNQVITRQEMAAMIVRALKAEKPETLLGGKTTQPFTDDRQLSTTFKEEIYQASKAGLIKGRADGSFDPLAKATRAETSVVLYRALNK